MRKARNPVKNLRKASKPLAKATPQPDRDRDEDQPPRQHGGVQPQRRRAAGHPRAATRAISSGPAGSGHLGNSIFSLGDAHGLYRRIYLTASCANLDDLLVEASGETPAFGRPIFENIAGFGPLFAPGGPCNP